MNIGLNKSDITETVQNSKQLQVKTDPLKTDEQTILQRHGHNTLSDVIRTLPIKKII